MPRSSGDGQIGAFLDDDTAAHRDSLKNLTNPYDRGRRRGDRRCSVAGLREPAAGLVSSSARLGVRLLLPGSPDRTRRG